MKIKKQIVFSGSGTLFPYLIGSIGAMEEFGIEPTLITGTSGGALVGALWASGYTSKQMLDIIIKNPIKTFYDPSWNILDRLGLLSGDNLYKFLKKVLPNQIKDTKIPLTVITTNFSKKYFQNRATYYNTKLTPDKELPKLIRASISIPLLFKYCVIDNEVHVDGGISNNFGVKTVEQLDDFKNTLGIKIDSAFSEKSSLLPNMFNLKDYLMTLIDTFMNTIEYEHIIDANKSNILYIPSKYSGSSFEHTENDIMDMYMQGYTCTLNWLKSIKNNL